ncbi:MAG: hypothetical protein SFU21_03425 [Flavihumibacter sp.]|nr:hypothetical protein [Flavihumibacter sp.]
MSVGVIKLVDDVKNGYITHSDYMKSSCRLIEHGFVRNYSDVQLKHDRDIVEAYERVYPMKSAKQVLWEHGISLMNFNDEFNTQLLYAMERYAEQAVRNKIKR